MRKEYTHQQVMVAATASLLLYGLAALLTDYIGSVGAVLLGAFCSLILPGYLLLRLLRAKASTFGEEILYSVGLSIASLYGVGLLLNTTLPLFGITTPLAPPLVQVAMIACNIVLLLIAHFARINIGLNFTVSRRFNRMSGLKAVMYVLPIITTVCGVLGSFALNNNGSNILSLIALVMVSLNVIFLLALKRGVPMSLYPYTIFWIALTILMMTSLRSWILSGHDILMEYHVFEITKSHLNWSMSYLQDAYNACLSITMLPTMLSGLLPHVADQYILRGLFQIIFAGMPVAVFMLARRYLTPRLAFLAAIFFMAQVPFLRDLMFMTRQETAFFFYALLALVMTNRFLTSWQRRALFATFGVALVLSHYSTVYVAVAVLLMARLMASRGARSFYKACSRFMTPLLRRQAKLDAPLAYERHAATRPPLHLPSWGMLVGLIAVILVWNVAITGTANNLQKFVGSTLSVLDTQHHNSTSSEFGLFSPQLDDKALTAQFVQKTSDTGDTDADAHYNASTYKNYQAYFPLDEDLQPNAPAPVVATASTADTIIKNVVKVLIVIGAAWLIFTTFAMRAGTSLKAMIAANILMLVVVMALPFVSVDYDVMRAYQQFLVFLCIPAAVGGTLVARVITKRFWYRLTAGMFILYFVFMSPIIPQTVGYGEATLSLNNRGEYYDIYYVHQSEVDAITWLSNNGDHNLPVYADWFAGRKIATFASRPVWIISNVLPQNITKDGYVFVDETNLQKNAAFVFYDGHELPYTFPMDFLKANKKLIYNNGQTEIWQ